MLRSAAHFVVLAAVLAVSCARANAQLAGDLHPQDTSYVVHDFHFASGETLAELRLHAAMLGTPQRDASGHVENAVLILHGTGGMGAQFLRPQFADVLFARGGLLDPAHTFVILPDAIGHGQSSKPSDGLHARFPHYDYADMVAAQYALVTEGLQIDHLRLVLGTSMGCMHTFLWGEAYPDFMDALMPLACLPVAIAGRNRLWRAMIVDAIRRDLAWKDGEYAEQPSAALRTAAELMLIAGSAPLQMQKSLPTREATDKFLEAYIGGRLPDLDANNLLYQFDASRDYDPSPGLERITAHVMWINSADDFINPPELGIAEREAARLRRGRFVLLPVSDQTRGHGTHSLPAIWQTYLADLLTSSRQ
jgi:homoserine O-acetyltransferase